jgi:putative flippase GtrA
MARSGRATYMIADASLIIAHLKKRFPRAADVIEPHLATLRKAISFALIGVINVGVDTSVFFLTYWCLTSHATALRPLDAFSQWCACTTPDAILLVASNLVAWAVAVSGSYVMNSFITFAAESGRKLRWLDYGTFVASGILGVIANTTALVIAAQVMPILAAKGCSILTAFAVNFTMSHFVVFRTRTAARSVPEVVATE